MNIFKRMVILLGLVLTLTVPVTISSLLRRIMQMTAQLLNRSSSSGATVYARVPSPRHNWLSMPSIPTPRSRSRRVV